MPDITIPPVVTQVLQISFFALGAYAVAFILGLVVWTARDISSRTRDWLVRILAVLLVLVFNLPGLLLYFVLRPRETLAEVYGRALEEEALLQDIEEQATCPTCKRRVAQDFALCPHCRTPLKSRCASCRRLLSPSWEVCPYCGQEPGKAAAAPAAAKGQAARRDEATTPAS
ncbi:MAG TPA: zinc ribbon domain-containing protein [Anaerolineae bacterium]|nr:zinc ribbon domain-containing protein [Anaerolineae bacterium]HOQ97743.1 zinc ribbon domain-containing protein [Anaerolineae bacterium]HPL29551.1 zinc ribbon domain-containing protein [Anaerolineae bacterium]